MRKTPLSLLFGLFILFSNIAISQCQYSFSSFTQSVYVNGDPTMANVNTLSTCTEYVFDYSIAFTSSTGLTSVTDDITIELPLNVSFQSLVSSNGTVTVNSSTANSVSLHVNSWNITGSTLLNIKLAGISSSCDASTVTGSPLAELNGDLACAVAHSLNGVTIVSPQLLVDMTGTSMKNIGDVDEIVFRIRNTGGNGTVIQNLLVDYTLNSNINSYLNTYYISGSSTQGTGNNIYTYTLPGSGIFSATLPASTIGITPSDFQNVLGHGYLGSSEEIYLHVPYFVNTCGSTTGSFNFKRDCGNSVTCDNVLQVNNLSVVSGPTNIDAGNVIPLHDINDNATFCATAGGQEMDMGWRMVGSNSIASGGPLGYTRATDLQLFVLINNSIGTVDYNTFTLSNGSNSINVGSVTTPVNTSYAIPGTAHTGTIYKIDLTQLPVPGTNWQPLGPNSLSDLDGDHKLDDLIEYGTVDIHVDYSYNTACPLYSDQGAYYLLSSMQWNYADACGTPTLNSAAGGHFNWGAGATCNYRYSAVGAGGELTLPPDVITNEPFVSELCFAPYDENYNFNGLEFDCPNGFHRVIYNIPNGYHLNTTGLTASSSNPGWFELPDMTVTSRAGGNNPTAQVSPIAQEYCNPSGTGRIIEVRFGLIPSDLFFYGAPYTMQLPCLELPMYLDCATPDLSCPSLPDNFGFDNMDFKLEFVCDETCITCSSYIVGGHASTYHHCMGLCDSYFATDPHPVFKRSSLGFVNTSSSYILGDDLTQPSNLTTSTEPTIDLTSAYPGDQIDFQVSGKFKGRPTLAYTPHTGASYSEMYLQIRYQDLLPGERKEARLFDLEQLTGDGITITESGNTSSSAFIPVSDLTLSYFVSSGIVHQNINFLTLQAITFMNDSSKTYLITSNLHLRLRDEPTSSANHYFFSYGRHILQSLRFEYKGTEAILGTIDGSCDDYGANFKILQPQSYGTDGVYIGEPTYCGYTEVYFRFYNDAALYNIANDFPNEYRAYGQLNPEVEVTIPAGYTYVSASFVQDGKVYNTSDPNNFDPNYIAGHVIVPISGETTSIVGGNTVVHFNGLDTIQPNPSWPSMDLEVATGSQYIFLKLLPTCEAPSSSVVSASGTYTLGVNQNLPAYQYEFPFTTLVPLSHYAPHMNVVNPAATVNAYDGSAEFDFSLCNESVGLTGPANEAWFALENSAIDGLDLSNATLLTVPGNTPVNFTTYTNGAGDQGIMANVGNIGVSACLNFKLTALVSPNGCVDTNISVPDFVTVFGGNSCDGTVLTMPSTECTNETTQFTFNRYPSDLELILPEDAYPTDSVEMCSGILEYNFILNSFEVGGVSDVDFWLDLPNGLTLSNITFSDPGGTPTSATLTSYDGNTYGSGGNLSGWDVLSHLGLTYLPGSVNTNHSIKVHLEVQSSCDYDLMSPVLCYANSVNSCGQQTHLLEMSSLPLISNVTLANDLVITPTITFSDAADTLSCNNTATVTLTITNNSSVSNLTDLELTAQVPASPLIVNPGTGTLAGNEITWNLPADTIPANSSITITYTITNPGVICQNDVPMSASIHFSQDVSCTSTGGSCNVELATDTVYFDIDVCCNCDIVLETSSEPKHCKYYGSATVGVSGGSGTYTYLWSDGQTTSTAVNLVPGTYTVIVTDEEGCSRTDSVTVGDNSGPLVITATADQDTVCSGETVSITPGGANSYSITSDGINFSGSVGEPFIVNPTTTTTYTIYGTDKFGCSGDTTITITVTPLNTPLFHIAHTYCAGTTIPALPTTSLNPYTGSWSPAVINNTTSGTYVFTPDPGQCAATYTLNVTINPNPVPVITTDDQGLSICAGTTIPLYSSSSTGNTWSTGETTSTIYVSAAGSYTVTVNNGNGCYATSVPAVVTVNPNPTVTGTFSACIGESGVTLTASPGPGTWSSSVPSVATVNSSGVVTPSTVNSGTTTIIYTVNASHCQVQQTFTVNPLPTISGTFSACIGGSAVTLTGSPGGGSWAIDDPTIVTINSSTGVVTPGSSNSGTTTVYYTSTAGCHQQQTFTVNPLPAISGTFTACMGGGTVTLTGSPGGGTWLSTNTSVATVNSTTGVVTPSASNSGTTTIKYTSSSGCQNQQTFTVYPNPVPTISHGDGSTTICSNSSITLYSSSATGNTWSTGATTQSITVSTAGTYTVTVNNGNGCSATSAPITITSISLPTASISGTITVCQGATPPVVTFTGSGGTAPYTFTYKINGGSNLTVSSGLGSNIATVSAPTGTAGTYTYSLVSVSSSAGCMQSQTGSIVVTVVALPTATISGITTVCQGATSPVVTFTGSGGTAPYTFTYKINGGSNLTVSSGLGSNVATVSVPTGTAGTYTYSLVSVSSLAGCLKTQTSSVVITVNPRPATPTISIVDGGPTTFCQGSSVTLFASSGTAYLWSNGALTQDITVGTSGNYSVQVTNSFGCYSLPSSPVTVTVNPGGTMTQPANITTCPGSSVTVPAFSGASSYTWYRTGASIGLTPTSGTGNIPTFTATNTGTSAITGNFFVTPSSASGCGGTTRQFTITVNPRPVAPTISGPSTICSGEYATLTAAPYTTNNYTWSPGGATTPSIVVPAPSSSTNYSVIYTDPATHCPSLPSSTFTVTKVTCSIPFKCVVHANLSVGVVSACERSFTNMSAVGSIPLTSSSTGYAYQWTVSNSSSNALVASGTGFNLPNVAFSTGGTFEVCLKVTRIAVPECYDQYCVTISVDCSSSLVLSTHTEGLLSKFEAKGESTDVLNKLDYQWSFGDGTFSTDAKPEHRYTKPGTYEVCMKAGYGDLTDAQNTVCRTITVTADEVETGVVPILSVNPNPTSGQTTVILDGAEGKTVEIKLFNMLGEEVTTLFTKTCCNDAMIRLVWNAEQVPPGVYLIKAQADNKTMVEKIVVASH